MTKQTKPSAGDAFREAYLADFDPENPGETVVLARVCALLDQLEEMESMLAEKGYVVPGGNKQDVASPLLPAIRAHTAEVSRLVRQLGMQPESMVTQRARKAANARWAKA